MQGQCLRSMETPRPTCTQPRPSLQVQSPSCPSGEYLAQVGGGVLAGAGENAHGNKVAQLVPGLQGVGEACKGFRGVSRWGARSRHRAEPGDGRGEEGHRALTISAERRLGRNGGGGICSEGPTPWGTGVARAGPQEPINYVTVQAFSELPDITLVTTVGIFTPWKWANPTNQGLVVFCFVLFFQGAGC